MKPLREGELLDAGYQEFLCTPETGRWLLNGGMTKVNGNPVRLRIVDEYPAVNAILIGWKEAA